MSREVNILLGPPGTGKTTQLIQKVKEALDRGIPPERIAYCSFTRKAADEAGTRASAAFGFDQKRFKYFRTLHSLAYLIMGLKPNQVMNNDNYTELGNILGLEFSGQYDESTERTLPYFGQLGDKCLNIYALSRAKKISIEEAWLQSTARSCPPCRTIKDFADNLARYKYKYDLYDFTDFMDEAKAAIDVDVFIIDEAQDLTRQQWDFAKRVSANAKEIWIGGDDDQAIFTWAGADLRTFLAIQGNRQVLPKSYRLPRQVHSLCQGIVGNIGVRYPKEWDCKDEEGAVNYLTSLEHINLLNGESWLLLGRHSHQLRDLTKTCVNQGVVYKMAAREWSNDKSNVRAVLAWEALRKGESINKYDLAALDKYTRKLSRPPEKEQFFAGDVGLKGKLPSWMDSLEFLPDVEREYIRLLRHNNEPLRGPGRVEISTIHGSKGGEADNVVIIHDITDQSYRQFLQVPDDEHRVFYVGASRAKKNLHILSPKTNKRYFKY
jgi:DNA helicase-2/ATP-dependent DNA helicase PcrA